MEALGPAILGLPNACTTAEAWQGEMVGICTQWQGDQHPVFVASKHFPPSSSGNEFSGDLHLWGEGQVGKMVP